MSILPKIMATSVMSIAFIASSAPASFAAGSLEIRNFIGTVNWSNGPLLATIEENAGDTQISGRHDLTIDGLQKDIDGSECKSSYGRFNVDWFGKKKSGQFGGFKGLEDLPILKITVPENTKLILKNSILFTDGAPNIERADLDLRHCGKVTLGNVAEEFALDNRGSADVQVGDTGQLVASLKGSGDLTGGDSVDVLIKSQGSADVDLGRIDGLELALHGSGDFSAQDVGSFVQLSSHGSGDIDLGNIDGNLSFTGHGSGDLEVGSVNGERLELESYGSGDVQIGGGHVQRVKAILRGSATLEYSGEAGTADLRTSGSGDIYINRVTGAAETTATGSGDIEIDDRG